jgi:hypothetical protein
MISEIISVFLTGAAQAYYARQGALGEINKKKLCVDLTTLRTVLLDISKTGSNIGALVKSFTFYGEPEISIGELVKILELQMENIAAAERLFNRVSKCLEIDAPQLVNMKIHLRGKGERIEIIYDLAGRSTLPTWVSNSLEPWERSELIRNPQQLIGKLVHPELQDTKVIEHDEQFEMLVKSVKPLTKLIKEICPPQYRV